MFVSNAGAAEALDNASRHMLADRPMDFQAAYQAAFADTRYRLLADSEGRAMEDAYGTYVDEIYKATGQRLDNPYAVKIRRNRDFAWDVEPNPDQRLDQRLARFGEDLSKLAATHPDLSVKSDADLRAGVADKAKALKATAEGGVNVGWAGLGGFAGSAAASMTDPLNAAALALGLGAPGAAARATAAARTTLMSRLAGAGAEIGATAAREGALNAGVTAAAQPQVMAFNQSLGIDHGWDKAAEEVAGAALGGAVLGGGLKAGGMGLGALLESWKGAKAAGRVAETLDTRDAETVLQAARDRQAVSPYPPTPDGDMASGAALAESFRALLRGEPVDPAILSQFQAHRTQNITDLAARAEGAKATTGTSDMVAYGVILPDQAARIGPEVKAMLGRDTPFLDTAVRRLDGEGIRHAVNEHAADKVPFRAADAAHIPDVVERGELVSLGRDRLTNRPFLLWRKQVDGNWLYVGEEVVGERTPGLRVKTAYWTEGPKTRGGEPGSPPPDARFTGSMPEGQQANVRNVGDGPVSATIAPPEGKSNAVGYPDFLSNIDLNALNYSNGLAEIAAKAGIDVRAGMHRQAVIDQIKEKYPAPASPSPPALNGYRDTRGGGTRFHGTSSEITSLAEGHYETLNYYGQGLYTTDAIDIAHGYARKGKGKNPTIYAVEERGAVPLYDMEAPLSADLMRFLSSRKNSTFDVLVGQAMDERPRNLRELYDHVRELSVAEGIPADDVQDGVFAVIAQHLIERGYGGLQHVGGLRTKKNEHTVRIYFRPEAEINLSKIDPANYRDGTPPAPKSKRAPAAPWPEELRPPAEGRPQTLVDFLRAQGGVTDTDGWLARLGVANRVRPGLISTAGLHLDEAALRAHEAGFFPDFAGRPDMDVLRHAIADELDGIHATIRTADQDLAARWRDWEALHAELDKAGVDPAGKSFDQVKAEMAAHQAAERASAEGLQRSVSDFLAEIRPDLDEQRAMVAEMRGHLMAEDIAVPTGLTDAEGRSVTTSAHDAMAAFDNEFEAWDAAFGCLAK